MWSKAFLLAFLGLAQVSAQGVLDLFPPLDPSDVKVLWSAQIETSNIENSPGVGRGNCAIVTPDQGYLITTSIGGTVTAYHALKGNKEWEYDPIVDGGTLISSSSCVVFPPNAVDPYMVYSVVLNEDSANAATRVIALDMGGNKLWETVALEGTAAGSPVTSGDGDYVFLTTNSNIDTVGHFYVLSAVNNGAAFYTQSNSTSPFSPPGIYHSPAEGHYFDGKDNTNDIIIWSVAPKPLDIQIGAGEIFAFQFPVGFDDTSTGESVGYIQLGALQREFQANTAPVLTNEGRSMFWGVTRSGFVHWVGSDSTPGLDRFRFDGAPRFSKRFGFDDDFRGTSVYATPALSSDPLEPFVFAGSAANEFVKQSWDINKNEEIIVTTDSLIKTSAKIIEDTFVYYIESANGRVHQANFVDLSDRLTIDLDFAVEGEFALSENGSILYVASTNGNITALLLSVLPVTPSPTASPTVAPTKTPVAITDAPTTKAPTAALAPDPTKAPVSVVIETNKPTIDDSSATQPIPMRSMALIAAVAVLFL